MGGRGTVRSTTPGTDIDKCIEVLASAMKMGPVALGFEAPMFVPYGRKRCDLDKSRKAMEIERSQPRPGRVRSPKRW